jgi:undecaprenyl-diphosphatase
MGMITYLQALILGIAQGISELFPVSSLGHSVLISYLFNWKNLLKDQSASESKFITYLVALHIGTALALVFFYRAQWVRIVKGFIRSAKSKKIEDADARLAWLLIAATIPAALVAVVLQKTLSSQFAKPFSAIVFLIINGLILLAGDRYIRNHTERRSRSRSLHSTAENTGDRISLGRAVLIGIAQVGALFAGISRSGITMVSGLYSGLNHEDAARFSFLLATPIILAAGVYKLPSFLSSGGAGIRGQALVGGVAAAIAAYFSVKYLDKYFREHNLKPFGIYCLAFAGLMLLVGIWRGHF